MKKGFLIAGYVIALGSSIALQSCSDDPFTPNDPGTNTNDTTWVEDSTDNGGGNGTSDDSTFTDPYGGNGTDTTNTGGGNCGGGGIDSTFNGGGTNDSTGIGGN